MQQRPVPLTAGDGELGWVLGKQPPELRRVACNRCGDNAAIEARGIDVGFERTPALEAVFLGDVALGVVQPGGGIARTQLGQPRLGGLLQPVDMGESGQRLGHGTPSFSAPGVRGSRARKKEVSA
jgi:hypothetical protein